ncbi:AAA family ATPase [Shewanella atlantica]|uniref:AAA family ATPase n=1 Tax=Shewanella atlantica TaxID=271099 RepID=UPI003736AF2A
MVTDVENVQDSQAEELQVFTNYEKQVNEFFKNKKFRITEDGDFEIKSGKREIDIANLSSGEKHILTILGRVALSSEGVSSFIADEPELSLHLDWQRKIIPAITALSPNTQVIVATHSPAIFEEGAIEIDIEECKV